MLGLKRCAPLLTATFPGKIGTYREDGEVSGTLHARGRPDAVPDTGRRAWTRHLIETYLVTMERLGREDVAAAAAAHHELGPEYSQATIDSFLEKVDSEIAARIDARLGGAPQPRSQTADVAPRYERRALWTGVVIGSAVPGIPFTLVAVGRGGKYPEAVAVIWLIIAAVYLVAFVASQLRKPRGRE